MYRIAFHKLKEGEREAGRVKGARPTGAFEGVR
jgi:hypothetical protein